MSTPAKAYSYVRFSTPEQSKGDSLRRQTSMAAEYCARHGLTLDTELTMQDLGVSAYRGKNLDGTGKLGAFLAAVKAGDVAPGSVLLVEALDRITRKSANRAAATIQEIVDAGVDVVTLNDGKRYTAEGMASMDYLFLVIMAMRAHDESANKGRRVAAAWAAKREAAKAGKLFTRLVPGWIEVTADGKRVAIPERVKVVRRVFKLFLAGMGLESIARTLNADKVPTFKRQTIARKASRWHKSMIQKMLRAKTVIGVLCPYTDSDVRTAQDEIPGYYPAVIDNETWERAQTLLSTKRKALAGRNSSLIVVNVLAGLARCPKCGGAMTRVAKSSTARKRTAWLICANAKVGKGCDYVSVQCGPLEAALIRVARDPLPEAGPGVADDLKSAEAGLEAVQDLVDSLIDTIERTPSAALTKRLAEREAALQRAQARVAELQAKADEHDTQSLKRRTARYRAAMTAKPFDPAAANVALREMVSKVVVAYDRQALQMHWRHDGMTEIVYAL